MKSFYSVSWVFSLLLGMLLILSNCSKDNSEYVLRVTVYADEDVKVANALIRVYAPVENTFVDLYLSTDEQGEAEFTFENDVIVDIIATKGSFKGCSFAQVKSGENKVKVFIKPYNADDNGCSENTP